MYSSFFYKLSWNAQFAAGLVLFAISFYIESHVLSQYLDDELLAMSLAAALELSKGLSILSYRFLRLQDTVPYPRMLAALLLLFRSLLIGLSVLCSVMFLNEQLDRPNLVQVQANDRALVDRQFAERRERIDSNHEEQVQRLLATSDATFAEFRSRIEQRHLPNIEALEAQLSAEMDNVVGGTFVGRRYREIERRLNEEKAQYQRELKEATATQRNEQQRLLAKLHDRHERDLKNLDVELAARLNAIQQGEYENDSRVENRMLAAFLRAQNEIFGIQLSALQSVSYFSIFLSLTMELGLIVIFEHIALSYLPLFQAEHGSSIRLNKKRIEAETELKGAGIDDAALRMQIEKEREEVERRIRTATSKLSA